MTLDPTRDLTVAEERPTFVSHLECYLTGQAHEADQVYGLSETGKPLLVGYDLEAIGWIGSERPRMVAVQSTGCAPIVKAFEEGEEHAPLWPDVDTIAAGIRVPIAVGDFLILRAVRESGGFAIAVTDEAIRAVTDEVAGTEGLLLCPEGAATYAAYNQALADGGVDPGECAELFNCTTGLKYPLSEVTSTLDRHAEIDYAAL